MNPRGGWALIRQTWLSWMQHRGFFFLLAFMWMVPPLVSLFVWSTAAGGKTIEGGSGDPPNPWPWSTAPLPPRRHPRQK
jgi:hypothetical protein